MAYSVPVVFVETPVFTRRVQEHLSDDDYAVLQSFLAERPDAGKIIKHSGGIRKLRWAGSGRGKRGGLRVSQNRFASLLGISANTLKNWEQGRRRPTGAAKVLLKVAARHPKAVLDVAA